MNATKEQIVALLRAFAEQRPGLEFGNYGDVRAWRAESRSITRDLHDARELLRAVEWCDGITADMLREAFRAYSGRLMLTERKGMPALDYCTGQYFPTEYRRAVCAVLASALWGYWRSQCMPPEIEATNARGEPCRLYPMPGQAHKRCSAGDWLRITARREFGRRIASRWFN